MRLAGAARERMTATTKLPGSKVGEITMDNELLLQNVILFPDLRQLVDFRYRHKMLNWAVARDGCGQGRKLFRDVGAASHTDRTGPANPRTPNSRTWSAHAGSFLGCGSHSILLGACLLLLAWTGFAQSQQKNQAQGRASSAAAIGSQTSDRLPNVAKSPRQYHRRDAGRPLLQQAMRLPPRA